MFIVEPISGSNGSVHTALCFSHVQQRDTQATGSKTQCVRDTEREREKERERETQGQGERDRETERERDIYIYRERERQTDRHRHTFTPVWDLLLPWHRHNTEWTDSFDVSFKRHMECKVNKTA